MAKASPLASKDGRYKEGITGPPVSEGREEGQWWEDLSTYLFLTLDWEFLEGRGQIQRGSSLNPYYLAQSRYSVNFYGINDN